MPHTQIFHVIGDITCQSMDASTSQPAIDPYQELPQASQIKVIFILDAAQRDSTVWTESTSEIYNFCTIYTNLRRVPAHSFPRSLNSLCQPRAESPDSVGEPCPYKQSETIGRPAEGSPISRCCSKKIASPRAQRHYTKRRVGSKGGSDKASPYHPKMPYSQYPGRYELFLPLHQLWKSYIAELLGLSSQPQTPISPSSVVMPNVQAMQAKLVKADYHGSIISGKTLSGVMYFIPICYSTTSKEPMPRWLFWHCYL